MFGMDLFFKTAAASLKLAQKGVENMVQLMELFAGSSPWTGCGRKSPAGDVKSEQEASADEKSSRKPVPSGKEASREQIRKSVSKPSAVRPEIRAEKPKAPEAAGTGKSPRESAGPETAKETAEPPKAIPSPKKTAPAIDVVFEFIAGKKKPVRTEEIMAATKFNKKKVQGNLYKLKKQGKIKMVMKGVYAKS